MSWKLPLNKSLFIGMFIKKIILIIIVCKNRLLKSKAKLYLLINPNHKKNITKNLLLIYIYNRFKKTLPKSLNILYRETKSNGSLIKYFPPLPHLLLRHCQNKINYNFSKRVHKILYSKREKNPTLKWSLCRPHQPNKTNKKEPSHL